MKRPRKGTISDIMQTAAAIHRSGARAAANDSDALIRDLGLVRAAAIMDADTQTAFRLPSQILALVDKAAKKFGVSRSAWIVEAIAEKLSR